MHFLFAMLHPGYVRNHESVIRTLAERGHRITLGFNKAKRDPTDNLAEELANEYASIEVRALPNRKDEWLPAANTIARCFDYLRYLEPDYHDAPALRARAAAKVPQKVSQLFARAGLTRSRSRRALTERVLRALQGAIPAAANIDQTLGEISPDVVVVTPLVDFESKQTDWVKSARRKEIPSCLAVYSWDNLTNKGLMKERPDAVIAWNDSQKEEALHFHGMAASEITITGSQAYDKWFGRTPQTERDTFVRNTGLNPEQPYLLYVCSSPFIGGQEEADFVEDWLTEVRASGDEHLKNVGILVRPHPQNAAIWDGVDLSRFGNVTVFPRGGANPVDETRRSDFFHSLHFSDGVIGINTSAMIEAGIVGRPVLTIRDPRFTARQEGTLHFRYLVKFGLVHTAETVKASAAMTARLLRGELFDRERMDQFLLAFVRPHGLEQAATPLCADALEAMASWPVRKPMPNWRAQMTRKLLRSLLGWADPAAGKTPAKKAKAQDKKKAA